MAELEVRCECCDAYIDKINELMMMSESFLLTIKKLKTGRDTWRRMYEKSEAMRYDKKREQNSEHS